MDHRATHPGLRTRYPGRITYRVRQFFGALTAQFDPGKQFILDAYLTPAQQALFQQMPHADQRHCLDIAHTLQERGHTHPALFQAALLHDVAKSAGVSLWHRVAVVLLKTFAPGLLARLAEDRLGSWRYGFYVHRHHPERGAALAQAVGCDPLAVELIRRHQESPSQELPQTPVNALLTALQEADERN